MMATTATEFIAKLSRKRKNAVRRRAEELVAEEMTLRQLRKARKRSQVKLAKQLGVKQAAVSKLERRADMYVSTLRGLVEAMGGTLEIVARFPDHRAVKIAQFESLDVNQPSRRSTTSR